MHMKKKIIAGLLIILLINFSFINVFASSKSEIQNKIDDKKEELQDVKDEKSSVLTEIDKLNTSISSTEKEISDLNSKIDNLTSSISEKTTEIEKKENEFKEKDKLLQDRLVALYEAGDTTYLDLLLTSGSITDFISRFSANASKSRQATSRKRALEKIQLDEIRPSSRKYPYIDFKPNREIGNEVLMVEGLSKTINGEKILDNLSFTLNRDDKVAFVGGNEFAKTVLFQILIGEMEPDEGTYKWGITTTQAYFPKDSGKEFDNDDTIVEWLTQYSEEKDVTYVRGFLGRMLFAGDDGVKKVKVLSGGEKVRCLLSKMMISGANVLILDEPTDHLDMESITALNNGMKKFPGVLLFSSRDHQIVETTANRIMEILPDGSMIDKMTTYDEYLKNNIGASKRQAILDLNTEEQDD